MTIWKYELPLGPKSEFVIEMPKGAKVLCVQAQDGEIFLWVKLDPDHCTELRKFTIYGTGNDVPSGGVYIGTVQIDPFVWHVFEEKV